MLDEKRDEFFYVTVMNENYAHPNQPVDIEEGVIRGLYPLRQPVESGSVDVQLLGSGTILLQVIKAAQLLNEHFQIGATIYSVTSFSELAREASDHERSKRLGLTNSAEVAWINKQLSDTVPIIIASDYVRAVPSQITPFLQAPVTILGTDGFGRSANRAALREFFEVDSAHIALAAIHALINMGKLGESNRQKALELFSIEPESVPPWKC
jgi:pyruvate dehydrogenase E1 component